MYMFSRQFVSCLTCNFTFIFELSEDVWCLGFMVARRKKEKEEIPKTHTVPVENIYYL